MTVNDTGDSDDGPNNLLNYPELSSSALATSGRLVVRGTLDTPNPQIETGNVAQHFYNEGAELMVRLEVTEKGERAIQAFSAAMN